MPQKFTFLFPGQSPRDLKADPFLGTRILQKVGDSMLNKADHQHHPWRFLLGVQGLPSGCYDFFRAAESVSRAMNRMQNMLYGGATLRRDLVAEMQERANKGDNAGATRIAKKIVRAMVQHGLWRSDAKPKNDEAHKQLERWRKEAEAALKKRHGDQWPRQMKAADQSNNAAYMMVANWLKWGTGEPGLCFYCDQAMANLLAAVLGIHSHLHQLDLRLSYFRKLRQRLGLERANYRKPLVISARSLRNGQIEIETRIAGRTASQKLSDQQQMSFGARCYYPLPNSDTS